MKAMSPAPRWTLVASVIAGVSYVATWVVELPPLVETAWKGAGVALLALHAAVRARSLDGWLLVAVMALGAAGDVLLETHGLTVGAIAFLLGHVVAGGLYLRHRRSASLAPLVLIPAVTAIAWMLPADRAAAPGVALYSVFLSTMAATALGSHFPYKTVGRGALMFVLSDLLIFARLGPLPDNLATGLAVWGLYYFGQMLICVGVANTLRPRTA
uniref:lysoplasmalogenase n=1 Tax=uncultured Caulobacter sp. TaxID=158749 RepID=UPI0025CEE7D7|nr:lysoplasmalogenase [uncultured Caulobacter sp.]